MKRTLLTLTVSILFIPFGISQDLPSYVPTNGLVAYYPFNGNANDASGNNYNLVNNNVTYDSDKFGTDSSAAYFSADGSELYLEESMNQLTSDPKQTYSFWFKSITPSNRYIFEYASQSSSRFRFVTSPTGGIGIRGETGCDSGGRDYEIPNLHENWHHFVISIDTQTYTVYYDGNVLYNADHSGFDCVDNVNRLNLGNDIGGGAKEYTNMLMDDIGIWNRALSEQEIQNLYTSSIGDIKLNGVVSAENNQIRNVADPTHGKDAVTKDYLLEKIALLQNQIDVLQSTSGSGTVTDQDGNSYPYLTYGDQVWTVKNAEMVTYRDGTPIPQVTDATEWANLTTGAWCYYDNDPTKGKLYNWYAVAGIHDNDENTPNKELAPEGWHVPSDAEWTELENYLIANGYNYDGTTTGNKIAKAMSSTTGWNGSTTDGVPGNNQLENNSSGFNAFPDGGRISDGTFRDENKTTIFWTSSEKDTTDAWDYDIDSFNNYLARSGGVKEYGSSVRFVRD
jgi:uncharacterized protein (TIGR02145 family)